MAEPYNPEAYREGPVRLLGYANEVGESFRPLVPRSAVLSTYAVATAYVATDAEWRSRQPSSGRSKLVEAGDTLVWQGLASVAVPGALINRVVWAAGKLPMTPRVKAWLPTATGLACIPFIVKPIDHATSVFMDNVVRPWYPQAPTTHQTQGS